MKSPTIKAVAEEVHDYGQYLSTYNPEDITDEEGNVGGDVRLQVHNGSWQVWTGDAQFDTDHRGAWGAAWVPAGCSKRQAQEIARDLIDQAGDMQAQAEGND